MKKNLFKNKRNAMIAGSLLLVTAIGAGILTQQKVIGGSSDFEFVPPTALEPPLAATEDEFPTVSEEQAFTTFKGMITQIINLEDRTYIRLENSDGGESDFRMTDDSIVIANREIVSYHDLAVGDVITSYYVMPQIMTMIYPPQVEMTVFVKEVEDQLETAYVDFFDEDLLSSRGDLKLNIDDMAPIVDINGNLYSEALGNNVLIAFYTFQATSYPAQATPQKIIVLDVPTQLDKEF